MLDFLHLDVSRHTCVICCVVTFEETEPWQVGKQYKLVKAVKPPKQQELQVICCVVAARSQLRCVKATLLWALLMPRVLVIQELLLFAKNVAVLQQALLTRSLIVIQDLCSP